MSNNAVEVKTPMSAYRHVVDSSRHVSDQVLLSRADTGKINHWQLGVRRAVPVSGENNQHMYRLRMRRICGNR
jgi:hypothetical protein